MLIQRRAQDNHRARRPGWLPHLRGCMSSDRHGVGRRHGAHAASTTGIGMQSVPLPTNRLDTGRPFVFLAGGAASSPPRPVIVCLVEKAVRLPSHIHLTCACSHSKLRLRCCRALRCGASRCSGALESMVPLGGRPMAPSAEPTTFEPHCPTTSRPPNGLAGVSAKHQAPCHCNCFSNATFLLVRVPGCAIRRCLDT